MGILLEKEMATHSSVLSWRIPWMEKTSRLQSMGSHRVGHDWSDLVVVVVSAYLRLLIFLPAILTPACASFSPAFLMMYTAYKLNKQGDNIQPWRTSFLIWNQSVLPCPVLTDASWLAYRFLKRQVRWSGIPISSWQIDGQPVKTVRDFILGGSKITADGDCSHEIKRRLKLWPI